MKILLVNGSPHKEGCTYTALKIIADELRTGGIESEILHIGNKPIRGCQACKACGKAKPDRCAFDDDVVNMIIEKAESSDGFIFGSPVYYASANSSLTSALDRAFYAGGKAFSYKPGAAVVSARRGGTTAAFDQLNKYFTISNMPVVSSCYWNMVHGSAPEEVYKDEEGVFVMKTLAKNFAWMLKNIEAGKKTGIDRPNMGARPRTNFIR